jgi:mono/diheme cytochrome c family protein
VVAFVRLLSPGYELYDRYCVSCHGPRGQAPDPALMEALGLPSSPHLPPAFDRAYFQSHTDEQLRPKIIHMVKLNRIAMPHFAGELTAEQVREVVHYLRTLPPES